MSYVYDVRKPVYWLGHPRWQSGKESPASAGDTKMWVWSLGREDPP